MPAFQRFFCPFCRRYCEREERDAHTQLHEEQFAEAYEQCAEESGHNIAFGSSRHSVACCFHTVQFRHPDASLLDPRRYVTELLPAIHRILELPFLRCVRLRAQLTLYITFYRRRFPSDDDEEEHDETNESNPFRSVMVSLTEFNLEEAVNNFLTKIIPKIEAFCNQNSGWIISKIEGLSVALVCGRNDSGGGRGCPKMTMPAALKGRRWCPNIEGIDGECFPDAVRYCLAYADGVITDTRLFRCMAKNRRTLYDRYPLNLERLPLPFEFKYFKTFEAKNPNIGLRVYHFDGMCITGPLYINTDSDRRPVHLLFIANLKKDTLPGHFTPITNISAMVSDMDWSKLRTVLCCDFCLQSFRTEAARDQHRYWCGQSAQKQKVLMPDYREHRFNDHRKTTRLLNIVYADMESKIDPDTKLHTPGYVGAMQVWHPEFADENNTNSVEIFKGDDCVMQFLDYLERKVRENIVSLDRYTRKPMKMSAYHQRLHETKTYCDFCEKPFWEEKNKCADHDHITGEYLHSLCSKCNLRRTQYRRRMNVVFHNLKGYDGHHLMRYGLAKKTSWNINPIYQSGDKLLGVLVKIPFYKGFENVRLEEGEEETEDEEEEEEDGDEHIPEAEEAKVAGRFRAPDEYTINFIDSYQFLPSSLSKLVDTLPDTPLSRRMLANTYDLSMEEGRRISKGIFPYTSFTSYETLLETTELPPREAFFNDLTEQECTPEAYALAQNAWNTIGCRNLEDYLIYYLKVDVGALADIFESFRDDVYEESGLDPAHYYGSPGLSLSWFFKHTKARPHTLTDPSMYEFFENGIRGGMTFVNIHEALSDTSDPNEQQHLTYIDMNNLYGSCMRYKQPYKNFHWLSDEKCKLICTEVVRNIKSEEADTGFIAEVDLSYPTDVQDTTLDLPLAPEASSVQEDQLSPHMKRLWQHYYGTRPYHGTKKLLLTHHDKQRYIVHHRALAYYVKKGLRITRCHRALGFDQKAFMKDYVDYHTERRSQATTAAKKNLHKYMVNALFGKTMEDVRKHIQRRVTHSPSNLFRNALSPLCESVMPLGPQTAVVTMRKTSVLLDKAIFIGQCILDTSKVIMYQLFDQMRAHPTIDSVQLIGGDTDSFFLKLHSSHSLDAIWRSFNNLDTSNYPTTHLLFSNKNKARLGCFKDETCGRTITSFIALSPKMYSFVTDSDANACSRAKGVKGYKKAALTHSMYQQAYANQSTFHVQQTLLRSKEHTIHTISQRKRALTVWEDKRIWVSPNQSYPYGYHRLPELLSATDEEPATKRPRVYK